MPLSAPASNHLLRLCLLTACTVALSAACGGGGDADPTPSPAVSAVPSTVAIDLAQADQKYVGGDTDGAVQIYSAAVLRGSPKQKQDGLWALSRIQLETGEASDASRNATALIASEPEDDVRERRAYLLLGYAEMAQGHTKEAREALEKYIRLGGPATPYAQIKLAEIASIDDDPQEAARGAEAALASDLPPAIETELMFALARYQEEAEDIPAALATLEKISNEGSSATDHSEALWEVARLAAENGDAAGQQAALRRLIASYPAEERALEALATSGEGTLPERALVLYRHRENEPARQAYESLLSDPNPAVVGEARYRLGILAERIGDPATAIDQYGAAIDILTSTGGGLLDDAYWDRGLALESVGRLDEAVAHYAALYDGIPSSEHAPDALARAAMIRYRQARVGESADLWLRHIDVSGSDEARSRFWLARTYGELGDPMQQQAQLVAAAQASPRAYYGMRAAAIVAGETEVQDPETLSLPAADWPAVESWLTAIAGDEPTPTPGSTDDFFASPAWLRAEEVLEAGLVEPAINELRAVINSQNSAWVTYRIARRMADEGYVRTASMAAANLLGHENPPPTLFRLLYPAKYLDQVNESAREQGVSPLLLLALVRQESYFDAGAVSVAGALGLTQVVPSTGSDIAEALGVTDFRESDLLNPETSLRFGAYYLASQLEGFGGNVSPTLAAYNGGPGNAARWSETAGSDPDLFLETIDFDETRSYVELVLENYAFYRYVYGVSDMLSLPLG